MLGDGGICAKRILTGNLNLSSFNGYVIDIGGQDISFVNNFSKATRVVMDINKICWALSKDQDVRYIIGDAFNTLKNEGLLTTGKEVIYFMNSLISVLFPNQGFELVRLVVGKMNPGDRLIITNLDKDHFWGDKKFAVKESENGVCEIYIKGRSRLEKYKSTIDSSFASHVLRLEAQGKLVIEKEDTSVLDCQMGT